jgi:hypothetical protein
MTQELKSHKPSLREQAYALLRGEGHVSDPTVAGRQWLADKLVGDPTGWNIGGLDALLIPGFAFAADEASRSGSLVDYALAAASAIPGGSVAKVAKPAAKKGAKALAEALKPKREAITAVNLREMSPEQALEVARSERHIIPQTDGGFVGAPTSVQTRADIDTMRSNYDELVEGGMAGAPWYQRTHDAVKEIAGPDPARQHLLAQELGITSPQSTPDTNLGFTLGMHNAYEAGNPAEIARTGAIARNYNAARDAGVDPKQGKKTGPFAGHVDPTVENPTTPANDIWQARSFGYKGSMTNAKNNKKANASDLFSRALTPQEHSFLDAEGLLAMDRANQKALGGRTNWNVGEIQAAPWVRNKASGLMERYGMSESDALAEASKTYADSLDKYAAHATYEMTPGSLTGHHTDLIGSPERIDFSADPRAQWTNEEGRDIMYDAMGMYQRPTLDATGVYQPPEGALEMNPAHVARPMVGFTGKSGERTVDPNSRGMMNIAEANRAYFSGQNAGAWSKPIAKQKPARSNALMFDTEGPMTPEQIESLQSMTGRHYNMPNVVDYGSAAAATNFGGDVNAKKLAKDLTTGELDYELGQFVPGATNANRAFLDSGYLGFEDAWSSGQPGAVTEQLFKYMDEANAPRAVENLGSDPAMRAKVSDLYDQSVEREAMTFGDSPANPLLQNARRIFAEGGYPALLDAVKKGLVPAAALVPFAGAMEQGEAGGSGM